MGKSKTELNYTFFSKPVVGSTFSVLAGLTFLMVCMTLPLVGPAGQTRPWATQNYMAFLGVLVLTFVFSVLASLSKMQRRKIDESPLPSTSLSLGGICIFLFLALITGLLKI